MKNEDLIKERIQSRVRQIAEGIAEKKLQAFYARALVTLSKGDATGLMIHMMAEMHAYETREAGKRNG